MTKVRPEGASEDDGIMSWREHNKMGDGNES